MTNKIKIAILALGLTGAIFTGCNSENKKSEAEHSEKSNEVYQCPMDCENGKTYTKPGKCPMCEMELEKKEKV